MGIDGVAQVEAKPSGGFFRGVPAAAVFWGLIG